MNKTQLIELTSSIREFCLSNAEADFEMVMDFVDSQIVPFEADDELVDHAMAIMLECEEISQQPSMDADLRSVH